MAIVCAVMGLFNLGLAVSGWAQIVTNTYPQNRFYIMPTGYANPGTVWRVIKPRTTQAGAGVYPNPAGSWIRMADGSALSSYSICDAIGRTLRKGRLSSGEAINLSGLAPGFYMLHAAREDSAVSTYKFTIK